MVNVVSNPTAVWKRLVVEASRIASWAKRNGTDEQKDAAVKIIEALNTMAHHFDLILMPANLAASIKASPAKGKAADDDWHENGIDQSMAYGYDAWRRGMSYENCPADCPSPDEWRKGWLQAYHQANER